MEFDTFKTIVKLAHGDLVAIHENGIITEDTDGVIVDSDLPEKIIEFVLNH